MLLIRHYNRYKRDLHLWNRLPGHAILEWYKGDEEKLELLLIIDSLAAW